MKHILSVAYDLSLATTRQLILEHHGYEVTSADTPESALSACHQGGFDLLIVGHSVLPPHKLRLQQAFREHSQAPVLSLSRNGIPVDDTTEYNAKASDPAEVLDVVRSALSLRYKLGALLNDAIEHTQGDFGTLQLLNRAGRSLRIVAQRGFARDFLGFFHLVHPRGTACGEAMRQRTRVIVEDVASSAVFDEDSRQTVLRADVSACHSTPLVSESGELVGMVSSHYRSQQRPSGRALDKLDSAVTRAMKHARQDIDLALAGAGQFA